MLGAATSDGVIAGRDADLQVTNTQFGVVNKKIEEVHDRLPSRKAFAGVRKTPTP